MRLCEAGEMSDGIAPGSSSSSVSSLRVGGGEDGSSVVACRAPPPTGEDEDAAGRSVIAASSADGRQRHRPRMPPFARLGPPYRAHPHAILHPTGHLRVGLVIGLLRTGRLSSADPRRVLLFERDERC